MTTIAQLAATLRELLTTVADRLAAETQFVRRRSKLTGAAFVQAVVLGWLANPQATEEQLAQAAAAVGVPISSQGLMARFGWPAAELMRRLLETAVSYLVAAQPAAVPILQRFNGVYLQDSTTITLPDALLDVWQGSRATPTHATVAGLKVQVQWDYHSGCLQQLVLQDGCAQDRTAPLQTTPLPVGALRLADLGYFSLSVLAALSAAGVYWLSRALVSTHLWTASGVCLDQVTFLRQQTASQVEQPVWLGQEQRLPCRLLALRVPASVAARRRRALRKEARHKGQTVSQARLALADWTLLVTNIPHDRLTLVEAVVLLQSRWQIELLFKLWKSQGQIDQSRSQQPWRILTEVYAKLLAMLVQHWLFLTCFWQAADRSLTQAAQTVRSHAMHLAVHLSAVHDLVTAIEHLQRCLQAGCRMHKSRTAPHTYQRLLAFGAAPDHTASQQLQEELLDALSAALP